MRYYIGLQKMNIMDHLLNKPYVNEVTLTDQNLCRKSRWSSELNLCMLRRFRSFQNVLWVSVGQSAAKLHAVKVGKFKKILPRGQSRTLVAWGWPIGRIFFKRPTLTACNFDAIS